MYVGFMLWLPGLTLKIGSILTLAGMYFSVYQIYRDGSAREMPADATAGACLAFHRQELARQKALLNRVAPYRLIRCTPVKTTTTNCGDGHDERLAGAVPHVKANCPTCAPSREAS